VGGGKTLRRPNVTGTATLVTGHHVSQQCQWAWVILNAMPLNSLISSGPASAKKLVKKSVGKPRQFEVPRFD
jgi:hypothetical protein